MSILVITTITGTLRARAIPKCSLCSGKSSVCILGRKIFILAHSNETVICCDHEKAVIRAATQQPEDRCP